MHKKSEEPDHDVVRIPVPKALYERVEVYCSDKKITPREFLIDAIGEKLQLSYKERRRRPRL